MQKIGFILDLDGFILHLLQGLKKFSKSVRFQIY